MKSTGGIYFHLGKIPSKIPPIIVDSDRAAGVLRWIIYEKAQQYWALREIRGSNRNEPDRHLVAMGGLEPPTPAL